MINHVRLRTNTSVKIGFRGIDTATQFLRRKALGGGLIQKACWEYFIRCSGREGGGEKEETEQE